MYGFNFGFLVILTTAYCFPSGVVIITGFIIASIIDFLLVKIGADGVDVTLILSSVCCFAFDENNRCKDDDINLCVALSSFRIVGLNDGMDDENDDGNKIGARKTSPLGVTMERDDNDRIGNVDDTIPVLQKLCTTDRFDDIDSRLNIDHNIADRAIFCQ
jgi:hypothetical protein